MLGDQATPATTPVETAHVSDGSGAAENGAIGSNEEAPVTAGSNVEGPAAAEAGAGLNEGGIPAEHISGANPAFPVSCLVYELLI